MSQVTSPPRSQRSSLRNLHLDARSSGGFGSGLVWLAWRQQRPALLWLSALLTFCVARVVVGNSGSVAASHWYYGDVTRPAYLVVAGVGLLWAAPLLAHEQQNGTLDLAYSQSVSRARWLAYRIVPLLVVGVAAPLVLVVADAASTHSYDWTPTWNPLVEAPLFVGEVLVTVGAGLFAGAVLRQTIPAMVVAGAAFLTARLVTPAAAHALLPMRKIVVGAGSHGVPRLPDPDGLYHLYSRPRSDGSVVAGYYSPGRNWAVQWIELGLLVAVTAVLIWATFSWMTRRVPQS